MVVGVLIVNPQSTWLGRIRKKCRVKFPVLAPIFRRFPASSESNQSLFRKNRSDAGSRHNAGRDFVVFGFTRIVRRNFS